MEKRFSPYNDAHEIFPRVLSGRAVMIQNSPYLEFVAATKFTSRGQARMRLMKVRGWTVRVWRKIVKCDDEGRLYW